jgi:hypothetical protein
MSQGTGISFTNLPTKNAGPPFDPSAVFNGLSVFTDGRIQLGDTAESGAEPGVLIAQVFLNTNGQTITFSDNNNLRTNLGPNFSMADFAGNKFAFVDNFGSAFLGDIDNVISGTSLIINPTTFWLTMPLGPHNNARVLQGSGAQIILGDVQSVNNKTRGVLNDFAKTIFFQADVDFKFQSFNAGSPKRYLDIDVTNQTLQLGDIDGPHSLNSLFIDIGNELITLFTDDGTGVSPAFLILNGGQHFVSIGCSTIGTSIEINDAPFVPVTEPNGESVIIQSNRGLTTSGYFGGLNGFWKFGKITAGAVALDVANYVEVFVDGTRVKLLIAS